MKNIYILEVVNITMGYTVETLYYTNSEIATKSYSTMIDFICVEYDAVISKNLSNSTVYQAVEISNKEIKWGVSLLTETIEKKIFTP